jgi:hypothetical protein
VIDLRIVPFFGKHFRGHVFRRSTEGVGKLFILHVGSGKSEIREFNMALLVEEDVLRLDVTVDYVILVKMMDCHAHFCEKDSGIRFSHAFDFA